MELLVPQEIKSDIGPSGFIRYESRFGQMNLRALFTTLENERYLSNFLFNALTNTNYVREVMSRSGINNNVNLVVGMFRQREYQIKNCVDTMSHKLPAPEYLTATNPVEQLNYTNREYLKDTARDIIMYPDSLIARFTDINQDTMSFEEASFQDYTASSYSDGVWRPEALFTDTPSNRTVPYWKPRELTFDPNSASKTPGHRYASTVYNNNMGRTTKKFPRPRHFPRHIDRSDYGLREAGFSDRRTQKVRGFDMSDLYDKPHY